MIWSIIWSCVYCYLIETPGDFTLKKLKAYKFVISGWVEPLQVLKRKVTTAMTQISIFLSPILPPTSVPPLFNKGLGYHDGKIVELKMFVGTF